MRTVLDALIAAVLLAVAFLACLLGLAWLALAMDAHWAQVRGEPAPASGQRRALRVLGALALAGSLALCLRADHASMAALVWIMMLAAGAPPLPSHSPGMRAGCARSSRC